MNGLDGAGAPFIVIGENIHCTRVVKRDGARGGADAGRPARGPLPDR